MTHRASESRKISGYTTDGPSRMWDWELEIWKTFDEDASRKQRLRATENMTLVEKVMILWNANCDTRLIAAELGYSEATILKLLLIGREERRA